VTVAEPLAVDGLDAARWLLGAATVGEGPTPEQVSVIQSLLHGYFGVDADATAFPPLDAQELGAAAADSGTRRRLIDLLVVVEFCRHPGVAEQADRIEQYARAIAADEPFLLVARDALVARQQDVMADWGRFREQLVVEPDVTVADAALADRLRALERCAAGSLGRAYFDFLADRGLAFPGEPGGGDASLVSHDFSHVLAGYGPDAPGELALQAMLTSATGFEHHFSGLVASLALYEAGKFDILEITPREAALDRPGAAAELADAFRRGEVCTCDFSAIDHLARVDDELNAVRADCGILARSA
jgi:hypothetical protein